MALSRRPLSIRIHDADGVGPVDVEVEYAIDSDNPEAVAVGASRRRVVLLCEAPRAAVAAFLSACQVTIPGDWPTSALPLPLPLKP